MKCIDCKNTCFCELYQKYHGVEEKFEGCTSGEPKYAPVNLAKDIIEQIKIGSKTTNFNYHDYFHIILDTVARYEYSFGIMFGCFIPLHSGHMSLIKQAISENDRVIIGVCGSDFDRGKDFIPFFKRIELMEQIYPQCIVVPVDDKKIGMDGSFSLYNWRVWCDELFTQAKVDPKKHNFTWYTGEPSYVEKLSQIYPLHHFKLADRSNLQISGTMIRKNPKKYEGYINDIFCKYLKSEGLIE